MRFAANDIVHNTKVAICAAVIVALLCYPFPVFAASAVSGFLYDLCIGIGGWFLWLGGMMLDYSIGMLVIGMGEMIRTGEGIGEAIDSLWVIIRDLFNILFIFGLIYIGFKTILNAGDSSTQRSLGMLIIAALLINFSLYATKVVIDVSNVAAYQIYQLMDIGPVDAPGGEYKGISAAFMQYAKLQSFSDANQHILTEAAQDTSEIADMRLIGFGIMVMIFMLITAFVFMAGAVFMVVRFIVLVLLMIFSPILLLGWVMPAFSDESRKRLKQLIKYALVAPAFLFMLYLSLTVLQRLNTTGTLSHALNPANAGGSFELIIYILFITGLVIASLMVAQKLGTFGADKAMGMLKSGGQWARTRVQYAAGSATFGSLGFAGRQTFGRAAQAYKKSDFAKRNAERSGVAGLLGRAAILSADTVSKTSFDARGTALGKQFGLGKGQKGGFEGGKKERQKKIDEREKRIVGLIGKEDKRIYAAAGVAEYDEMYKELVEEREKARAAFTDAKTDEARKAAYLKSLEAEEQVAKFEKGEPDRPEAFDSSKDAEWTREKANIKLYNKLRSGMGKMVQQQYAANLSQRGNVYIAFIRSKEENKNAADAIRKEANKGKDAKLIDAVKELMKDDKKEEGGKEEKKES